MEERYNNMIKVEELSSTNDYASEIVHNGSVPDFTIVMTEFQTKGRGQRGNYWVSNAGENLLFSIVVHPTEILIKEQFILSQAVSVALCELVSLYCDSVCIKWPNDIYVGDKKIAGILIENSLHKKEIETAIIGIGLNVNQLAFAGVPNPTSLRAECGHELNRDEVLTQFLSRFRQLYSEISSNAVAIRSEYKARLYEYGKMRQYKDATGVFSGQILDVDTDGQLLIADANGDLRRYYFKEVAYLL